MTIAKLKSNLTQHFNKYIRLRDTDENGFGLCISCGNQIKYGSLNCQAGHYYPAPVETLRYHEYNVHLQCKGCNHFKSGNLIEYRKNLVKKISLEGVEKLDMLSEYYAAHGHRWDRFTLETKIKEYKDKVKQIAKSKMFKV